MILSFNIANSILLKVQDFNQSGKSLITHHLRKNTTIHREYLVSEENGAFENMCERKSIQNVEIIYGRKLDASCVIMGRD